MYVLGEYVRVDQLVMSDGLIKIQECLILHLDEEEKGKSVYNAFGFTECNNSLIDVESLFDFRPISDESFVGLNQQNVVDPCPIWYADDQRTKVLFRPQLEGGM